MAMIVSNYVEKFSFMSYSMKFAYMFTKLKMNTTWKVVGLLLVEETCVSSINYGTLVGRIMWMKILCVNTA